MVNDNFLSTDRDLDKRKVLYNIYKNELIVKRANEQLKQIKRMVSLEDMSMEAMFMQTLSEDSLFDNEVYSFFCLSYFRQFTSLWDQW